MTTLDLSSFRAVRIGSSAVNFTVDKSGARHYSSKEALAATPTTLTECLVRGAAAHPNRTMAAERGAEGQWIKITYSEMLSRVRSIAEALLGFNLSAERPLMILSGNDLAHLQMALAAMYIGVPYSPISPAASTLAADFDKLSQFVRHLTPGMVFASDGNVYGKAIIAAMPADAAVVLDKGDLGARVCIHLSELLAATPSAKVDAVNAALTPDTIAKFLFTSGSTKQPKAVTTTQRMLCSNQQMLLQTFPEFDDTPPVLLDWLPWSHTFGGSHNLGIALYNGGTYYIDNGKPTPKDFKETVRNLKEISPTVFFNVPKGWELLTEALEADAAMSETFFAKMKLFFFAGAGLSQAAWDKLEAVSEMRCGQRIRIMAGLGMTETSPSCTFTTGPVMMAGYVGLPAPGCEVKLVDMDGKFEARFKGPHVMPGYWRSPENTAEAFDEEGYYRSGDAVRFVDPNQPELGLVFDGRIAEDFKLSSGTFVSVGPLRARVISEGAPYIQDVVITGINRDAVGLMIFPRVEHCHTLSGLAADAAVENILSSAAVRTYFKDLLKQLNRTATGSASRVSRLLLLSEPPLMVHGEITDKGSINQRAVLTKRAHLVEEMYGEANEAVIYAD